MRSDSNSQTIKADNGTSIPTTIVLPTGRMHVNAFAIRSATDSGGGTIDPNRSLRPKYFSVFVRYPHADATREALAQAVTLLGCEPYAAGRPLNGVVNGYVKDWLSTDLEIDPRSDGAYDITYFFEIDVYHNPALDKITHGDTIEINLTHTPTRAELGILDDYSGGGFSDRDGAIRNVSLDLPGGPLVMAVSGYLTDSASASAPASAPATHLALIRSGRADDLMESLRGQAAALKFDAGKLPDVKTERGRLQRNVLSSTDVYDLDIRMDFDLASPDRGGSLSYRFRFK